MKKILGALFLLVTLGTMTACSSGTNQKVFKTKVKSLLPQNLNLLHLSLKR